MKTEFNKLIKQGLKKENISLRELARGSGLDVSFLSKILNGKRNPPSKEKKIRKIGKILNIDQERLIFASGRIPSNFQKYFNTKDILERISRLKGFKE
ncbi:MAG: helix-turn-helix domain-containing protein [Elusimicrobiota bacterium]